jgi:hypothetical protein
MGARFIPRPALHPGRPGEHPIIVTRYRPGIVSALPHRLSPDTLRATLPPCGWSFLKTHSLRHGFCDCSPTRHPDPENFAPANRLIQNRVIRKECCVESASVSDIAPNVDPTRDSTLGDWGPRAERLDRSLDAYTPVPSTPSSMGALVQSETIVANGPSGLDWLPIFGRGFRLRCFQPLSSIAWLPGSALSDNR